MEAQCSKCQNFKPRNNVYSLMEVLKQIPGEAQVTIEVNSNSHINWHTRIAFDLGGRRWCYYAEGKGI